MDQLVKQVKQLAEQQEKITEGLGKDWIFLETLYRIYSTAGNNIAHIDVTAALCEEYDIRYEDVDRIETVVNWLETEYPSPAFPSRSREAIPDNPQHYAAWGVVRRGFPLLKRVACGIGEPDPPEVLDLMQRDNYWTKISGGDERTSSPYPYPEVAPFAHALVDVAPDRLIWGSNWPHSNIFVLGETPNDGELLDLMLDYAPDEAVRNKILVDNPARLFGFDD